MEQKSELIEVETKQQQAMVVIPVERMTTVIAQIKAKEKEYFREGHEWVTIGKGKHLQIEGWQTLGNFFGLGGKTKIIEEKWNEDESQLIRAKAEGRVVRCDTGVEVAAAEQIATLKGCEAKWHRQAEDFEIMGMAQTRALSRAFANILRGIAEKLGFQSTPAEESQNITSRQIKEGMVIPSETELTPKQSQALLNEGIKLCKEYGIDYKEIFKEMGILNNRPKLSQVPVFLGKIQTLIAERENKSNAEAQ